jgi:hypothetical protein
MFGTSRIIKINGYIKEGISWHCADSGDPNLIFILDNQDIVIADRFLCPIEPTAAERILRKPRPRPLKPGGYLFVSGVDLSNARRAGHPSISDRWPLEYWSRTRLGGAML